MVYIIALISIMLGAFAQYLLKVGVQQVIWYKDEGFYTLMSGLINMRLLIRGKKRCVSKFGRSENI